MSDWGNKITARFKRHMEASLTLFDSYLKDQKIPEDSRRNMLSGASHFASFLAGHPLDPGARAYNRTPDGIRFVKRVSIF